jgi:hypothetical protein
VGSGEDVEVEFEVYHMGRNVVEGRDGGKKRGRQSVAEASFLGRKAVV